jgi:hypothetical protein
MIIGINGKIGSGKDTVGSIIQYLTATDTSDKALGFIKLGYGIEGYHNSTFEIKKFAGKLKQIGSILSGVLVEMFEDQEFKKLNMNPEWGMTYREFLQKLGTEAMRDGLHTNVWVNALFADYKPQPNKEVAEFLAAEGLPQSMNAGEQNHPNWIITDMRFPNEMEAVELREGVTIRVVRPGTSTGTHPSEIALDGHTMHYEIINDGTIEDLVEKVRTILIKENII